MHIHADSRIVRVVSVLAVSSLTFLSGCGGALYAVEAGNASAKVEEAKALGAEKYAPYEYYLAIEHQKMASEEAAQADYSDAYDLASEAEDQADRAIKKAREFHKDAGR